MKASWEIERNSDGHLSPYVNVGVCVYIPFHEPNDPSLHARTPTTRSNPHPSNPLHLPPPLLPNSVQPHPNTTDAAGLFSAINGYLFALISKGDNKHKLDLGRVDRYEEITELDRVKSVVDVGGGGKVEVEVVAVDIETERKKNVFFWLCVCVLSVYVCVCVCSWKRREIKRESVCERERSIY